MLNSLNQLTVRYLGIDYGGQRIGLALSDEEGRLAFPLATVSGAGQVLEVLAAHPVAGIVVGLPRSLGGRDSRQSGAVRAFAAELGRAVQLPIVFENEMFTTKIAERHTARTKVDASAAALILQSYLDKRIKQVK